MSTSIVQVNLDRLLAMGAVRIEPDTGLNLGLGHHDTVHTQATTRRIARRSDNVSLDREFVRECTLAGLAPDGRVDSTPFVGLGVASERGLA